MFVKIFTDILSNQISFRVVNFFYCFFNSEQHYIDPEKNLVLKDYRPVLMVFLLSKNGILHSVLLSVFYALNVLLFLSSALIYLHNVNKKTSVYPPFSLMNLIAIIE